MKDGKWAKDKTSGYVDQIISIAKELGWNFTYNDKLIFDGNQLQISIGTATKTPGKIHIGFT